jgi:hypothetical protein
MTLYPQLILLIVYNVLSIVSGASSSTGPSAEPAAAEAFFNTKNIILIVIIAICGSFSLFLIYRIIRLYKNPSDNSIYPTSTGASSGSSNDDSNTARNWKIDSNDIEIGELIGTGGLGKIYKGKWRGLTVAIKELIHSAKEDTISSEMSVLIKVRHPNLVLFMGISQPSVGKLHIINEYMSRGNLYSVLHDKGIKLDWKRRIQFAIDTARAMNYLHCSKPPILHKSLNSINILIDKEFVAKVSDYSLDAIKSAAKKSGVCKEQ